jgi:hypothetical protein
MPGSEIGINNIGRERTGRQGEAWWVWAILTAVYAALVYFGVQRPLWYDELLTYYIAKAPTAGNVLHLIARFDFTPPPTFFLTRWSISLFGYSLFGTRLPSILEFYAASGALFLYTRRKVNVAAAACAVLLLWYSPNLYYATEARPYALMLAGFLCLLLFREMATAGEYRKPALWGMGFANACLLASHAFAVFSLVPFFAAEAARYYSRRRPDYGQWLALTLPVAVMLEYIPLARHYRPILYPPVIQGSLFNLVHFFVAVFEGMGPGLFIVLLVALLVPKFAGSRDTRWESVQRSDLILFAALLANPFLLNLLLGRLQTAYWDRYSITTAAAIYIAMTVYLALRLELNRIALYAGAIAFLLPIAAQQVARPMMQARRYNTEEMLKARPDLPLVAVSALTFLEMDHEHGSILGQRLFYLQNREAAVKYSHETIFEDFEPPAVLKQYFPIRGSAEQYSAFIQQHRDFLMLASPDFEEEWLPRKLSDDGARFIFMRAFNVPYRNSILYEVVFPSVAVADRH